MVRSVDTWVGSSDDAAIPKRVRLRVFERYGGICQLTQRKIRAGDEWDLDHQTPLRDGGRHAEDNLWPVLRDKHREKTAAEARVRTKVDRVRAKHLGIWPQGKGWNRNLKKKLDGSVVRREPA
jgi:5-methylcytosine-specific restriction protein A